MGVVVRVEGVRGAGEREAAGMVAGERVAVG